MMKLIAVILAFALLADAQDAADVPFILDNEHGTMSGLVLSRTIWSNDMNVGWVSVTFPLLEGSGSNLFYDSATRSGLPNYASCSGMTQSSCLIPNKPDNVSKLCVWVNDACFANDFRDSINIGHVCRWTKPFVLSTTPQCGCFGAIISSRTYRNLYQGEETLLPSYSSDSLVAQKYSTTNVFDCVTYSEITVSGASNTSYAAGLRWISQMKMTSQMMRIVSNDFSMSGSFFMGRPSYRGSFWTDDPAGKVVVTSPLTGSNVYEGSVVGMSNSDYNPVTGGATSSLHIYSTNSSSATMTGSGGVKQSGNCTVNDVCYAMLPVAVPPVSLTRRSVNYTVGGVTAHVNRVGDFYFMNISITHTPPCYVSFLENDDVPKILYKEYVVASNVSSLINVKIKRVSGYLLAQCMGYQNDVMYIASYSGSIHCGAFPGMSASGYLPYLKCKNESLFWAFIYFIILGASILVFSVAYKIGKLIRVAPSFISISASGLRVLMGLDLIPALLWFLALVYSSLKFIVDIILSGLRRWIVGPEKPFHMPKFRYVSAKTIWVMLLLSSAAKAMYTCQDNASLGNPIMSYGSSGECDYNSTSGFASCGIDQNFKADIVGRAGGSYNFAINAKVSIDGSTIEAIDKRKLNINIGRVYYDVAVDPMYFALMHRTPFTGIGSQFNSYESRAGGGSHIDVVTPDNANKGVFCVVTDNDCDTTVPLNECLVHDNRICCSLHALRDRLVYTATTRNEATSLGDISGFPWMRDIVMAPGPGVCSVASTNRQTVNCYKNTQVSTDPTSYARVFEIISGSPKIDLSVQTDDQCFNLTIPLNTADSRKISVYGGTIELSVRGPIPSFPYVGRRFGLFLDSTNPAMQPERNFFSGVAGGHRSGFISGKWADSAHGTQDNPGAYQFKRSLPSSSTDYSTYTAMTPTNQWAAGAGTWCHSCSASDSRCEFYDGLNDPITIIDSDEENWPDFNLQALEYGNFVAKRRDDTKSWVGELLTDWEFSLEMLKAPALTIDGVVKGINLTAVIDKNKKPCPMVSVPASTQNMTIGSSMTSSIKVTIKNSSPNCGSGFVSFEISSNGDVQGASTVCPVGPVDHACVLNFYPDENEGMIEYTLSYDGEVFKKDGLKFSARDAINPRNANAAQDSSDAADIIGGHRTPGHTSTGHSFGFALGKMVSFGNLFGTGLFGDLMGFGLWIILGLAVYFILTRASWPRMGWMSMKPKSVYELPVVGAESVSGGQKLRKRMPYSGRDF